METTDIFGDLWDRALGVFDKAIDLEKFRRELNIARDVSLFKAALASETVARQSLFNSTTNGGLIGGVSNTTLLMAAGLGIGALLLFTR